MSNETTLIGQCSEPIFNDKYHALIGVSPFNSYFSETLLIKLFSWGISHFRKIHIFLPEGISTYTFLALGYTKERAEFKTRRQDAYLRNKVFRALDKLGIPEEQAKNWVITLPLLQRNSSYQGLYSDCLKRFEEDPSFRAGCLSTSHWILANHKKEEEVTPQQSKIAVQYFLAEFPLFMNTPAILNVPSSLFVYHSVPAYLKTLYENSAIISENQGFLKVMMDAEIS